MDDAEPSSSSNTSKNDDGQQQSADGDIDQGPFSSRGERRRLGRVVGAAAISARRVDPFDDSSAKSSSAAADTCEVSADCLDFPLNRPSTLSLLRACIPAAGLAVLLQETPHIGRRSRHLVRPGNDEP